MIDIRQKWGSRLALGAWKVEDTSQGSHIHSPYLRGDVRVPVAQVATIAANGDEQIGKMITEAFEKAAAERQVCRRYSTGS